MKDQAFILTRIEVEQSPLKYTGVIVCAAKIAVKGQINMHAGGRGTYIAGFDLGSASLGWSAIVVHNEEPRGLLGLGAETFNPGVTNAKNAIERGADESRNKARRLSRSGRRRTGRRAARLNRLFRLLQQQQHGLLPPTEPPRPGDDPNDPGQARQRTIDALDKRLQAKWEKAADTAVDKRTSQEIVADLLPYLLRKRGLYGPLDADEFGRVLMHLAQRRGFLASRLAESLDDKEVEQESMTDSESAGGEVDGIRSGRQTPGNPGDRKRGVVQGGIEKLKEEIRAAGAKTLGEFFSGLNPHEQRKRIRARWTAREMYEEEFDLLWEKQAAYNEKLTLDFRKEAKDIIFFYRPVTWDPETIGYCEL